MTRSSSEPIGRLLLCFLVATALALPVVHADQAQYFYDELGRLVGVVDGARIADVYSSARKVVSGSAAKASRF